MATKKAVTKKPAAKKPGKSMVKWDEELLRRSQIAVATADSSSGGAKTISTKSGVLTVDGAEVPGNKFNVIILDHCIEHAYYEGKYDSDNPQPPAAWALGRDAATLRWDEKSIPEYAGELTKDSDINQFGTADTGRGKAAKNIQRLMLITEHDLEDIETAEARMIKVPVTSVKAWNGYVKRIAESMRRPPLGVITEISLKPDAKSQFRMEFKLVEEVEPEHFEALFAKADGVEADLFRGYEPRDEEEEDQRPQRGRQAAGKAKGGAKRPVQKAAAKQTRNVVAKKAAPGKRSKY